MPGDIKTLPHFTSLSCLAAVPLLTHSHAHKHKYSHMCTLPLSGGRTHTDAIPRRDIFFLSQASPLKVTDSRHTHTCCVYSSNVRNEWLCFCVCSTRISIRLLHVVMNVSLSSMFIPVWFYLFKMFSQNTSFLLLHIFPGLLCVHISK